MVLFFFLMLLKFESRSGAVFSQFNLSSVSVKACLWMFLLLWRMKKAFGKIFHCKKRMHPFYLFLLIMKFYSFKKWNCCGVLFVLYKLFLFFIWPDILDSLVFSHAVYPSVSFQKRMTALYLSPKHFTVTVHLSQMSDFYNFQILSNSKDTILNIVYF